VFPQLRVRIDLEAKLAQPCYKSMLDYYNQNRTRTFDKIWHMKGTEKYTAASLARQTTRDIASKRQLLGGEVLELNGPVEFYRAHDGGSISPTSAGTLGRCWVDRELVANLAASTASFKGEERILFFMDWLRACSFVLKEWNEMKFLACMRVPDGCRVVVVKGKGDWNALLPPECRTVAGRRPTTPVPDNVAKQLQHMSIEGTTQYVIPLFNGSWVNRVDESSPSWPFYKTK
jgi:hypothetical protein